MTCFLPTLRRTLPFGSLLFTLFSCIDPYDPGLKLTANVLVVDGSVTDLPERQKVKISRSQVYSGRSATAPLPGARVEIVVNGNTVIPLTENREIRGLYEAPEGFRGQAGNSYQLRFSLADGQRYESTAEPLVVAPRIEKVYDKFDAKGIANAEKTVFSPAHLLYVDVQDPASERNFYRWNWTLWESQVWCASCERGIFIQTNAFTGDGFCQSDRTLPVGNVFDYTCISPCWDIFQGYELNLFADNFSNGKTIVGRLAAKIPYYQAQSALVEIRQQGLSAGAYQYYRLFETQTQTVGGLADTPPAPIVGNIRNVANDQEPVVGYFSASGVASVRYWLTRQNTGTVPIGLMYALFGRNANPEPSSPLPPRPPASRCVLSDTRTPVKPAGWR